MNDTPRIDEPMFITDEIEAELLKHMSTGRLYELLGFEYLRHRDGKLEAMTGSTSNYARQSHIGKGIRAKQLLRGQITLFLSKLPVILRTKKQFGAVIG
ncbi:hypothetical protein [Pseudomonas sp. GM_Psu_2]|uniref:hypothetical protein n=1 Tax=unclassified Pseudomonas TaxID=196821 RepID=UPI00226A72D7|nr:hypothetical protein [Pseudomonas sp. GM_Psu_2]